MKRERKKKKFFVEYGRPGGMLRKVRCVGLKEVGGHGSQAPVYVSSFLVSRYLLLTIYRYMAGDLCNITLSFLGTSDMRALNLSSSDPRFKQLERFFNNVQISIPSSNGTRMKTIRSLIERAGKFVFSKNVGQESTVAVCLLYISSSVHSIRC